MLDAKKSALQSILGDSIKSMKKKREPHEMGMLSIMIGLPKPKDEDAPAVEAMEDEDEEKEME